MREDRLQEMKQSFDAIPIPEELENRVRTTLAQGEEERRRAERRAMARRFWKRAGTWSAAAAAALVLVVNAVPGAASAMEQVPVLGAITRVVTFRTFQEERGHVSARVEVPHVEGAAESLNAAVQDYTEAIIREYREDTAQSMTEQPAGESDHYDLDLSYSVATDSERVFALRFDKSLVMASGVESVQIYSMDKVTGKLLALGDLFRPGCDYLDLLTGEIQNQMEQRMEENPDLHYWLREEIEEMNFTRLSEDTAFYLDQAGQLVLVFDEGDVAPMYMGVVEFTIPSAVTAEFGLPDYFS